MDVLNDAGFRAVFDKAAARFPGAIGAGFTVPGQPPVVHVHGPRAVGEATQVSRDAAWHIGSVTKTFTATLVLRLAEQGRLTLEAPLIELLPGADLHPDWQALTLMEALSHTGGLRANFTFRQMLAQAGPDLVAERRARLAAHWTRPLPRKRERFVYSNIGYVLAGHVAETLVGQPWETLVRQEIADPFGLTSLGFGPPDRPDDPLGTRGVLLKHAAPADDPRSDNPAWLGPAGTVHLSIADLLRWGALHLRAAQGEMPDFLSAASCQVMQEKRSAYYGLGWIVKEADFGGPVRLIGHNGSNTFWVCQLYFAPEKELCAALCLNRALIQRSDRMINDLIGSLLSP